MRQRRGGIVTKRGKIYARVTWVENGKRRAKWRKADNYEHAQSVCTDLLKELPYRRSDGSLGPPESQPHHQVYFIQMVDGHVNPIKIGVARDIRRRVYSLSTGSPFPLRVLYKYTPQTSPMLEERQLHRKFEHCRLRGEWFLPSVEIPAHIRSLKRERRKKQRRPRVSQLVEVKAREIAA